MGGGWRLDFVGEWKLKHVPCKSQFPLYVYAILDEDDMEHQDSDHDDEFHGLDDNTGDLPDCYIADPNPKELLPDNQLGDRDLYPESEPGGPFPPHDDDDDNQGCDDEGAHTYSTTSDAMCPWHEGEWANDGPWAERGLPGVKIGTTRQLAARLRLLIKTIGHRTTTLATQMLSGQPGVGGRIRI